MKKLVSFLVCLTLMVSLLCPMAALAEGFSVTDGLGREVLFDAQPQTCASITPANTEILFALGLKDAILGIDTQSNYPPEVAEIEARLGDYYAPSIEAIVALNPDVVFASTKLQQDAIDQLVALGVNVVCNEPTDFDEIASGIELVARVMGVDASPLTAEIQAAVDEVSAAAPGDGKRVYFAISFGDYGNYTAGPGTFIDDMIRLCGGVNVAGDMPVSWPEYGMEQLAMDDPDVVLLSDYVGDGSMEQQLVQTPGFEQLRCVKEGRVYGIDADTSSRPGPRIGEALREIAAALGK